MSARSWHPCASAWGPVMVIVDDPYSRLAREHAREMWAADERRCKSEDRRALICALLGMLVGAIAASACWVWSMAYLIS